MATYMGSLQKENIWGEGGSYVEGARGGGMGQGRGSEG